MPTPCRTTTRSFAGYVTARGPMSPPLLVGFCDIGRLLAEGIARAPYVAPAAIKDGLERVKFLDSASGRPGTWMGFGTWERSALLPGAPTLAGRSERRGGGLKGPTTQGTKGGTEGETSSKSRRASLLTRSTVQTSSARASGECPSPA
jgi:hypothetical protein